MRVIAGEHRGRKLNAPIGIKTRPTADRVKEALFNIISSRINGSTVLDLFAGSGSLGIEALSRGAKEAVFVDNDSRAYIAITNNLYSIDIPDNALVLKDDAAKAICYLHQQKRQFDLIFIDPPYKIDHVYLGQVIFLLYDKKMLSPDGMIIFEHSAKRKIDLPEGLVVIDERKYGQAVLTIINQRRS